MTVDEFKTKTGYVRGAEAPRCASCKHVIQTKKLRCMEPTAVKEIGGFAVNPDAWCPLFKKRKK